MTTEFAIFGAGCFWSPEYHFNQLDGVISVMSGYSGGDFVNPTYKDVCTGKTGHAETVRVEFDPSIISYEQLLDVFWAIHDPTQKDRQGPDVGTEYRSAAYYFSPEQHEQILRSRDEEQKELSRPIVTEIAPAKAFYDSEEYHHNFIERTGWQCHRPRRAYRKITVNK